MANKKVIIRVDGNAEIGLGHLYRGIALAEILKNNFTIEFLTRKNTIVSPISNSKFEYNIVPEQIELYEEPKWISDNYAFDTIVVLDGYHFSENYQQSIKERSFKLVYIDDLIKGKQIADLVINHSPGVKESDYITEDYTQLALGLNYALLRESFINFDRDNIKPNKEIKNIFISFGGADINDFSYTVVTEILNIDHIDEVNVVLGAAYKNIPIFDLDSTKLKIHKNVSEHEIFKLMGAADVAIVPASTISIELASVGTPMILGYFVDNQINIYNGFIEKHAATGIGNFSDFNFDNLKNIVASLNNSDVLSKQSRKLLSFFKGSIEKNLLSMFCLENISIRMVSESDMKFVFNLSNDTLVRSNSYDSSKIKLDQHKKWFQDQLKDSNILFYIVEIDNVLVGQVRFSIKKDYAVIGIAIINKFRGKGLAQKILNIAAKEYFKENKLPIYAYIKKTNLPSVKSFEKTGFTFYKNEIVNETESLIYKKEKL